MNETDFVVFGADDIVLMNKDISIDENLNVMCMLGMICSCEKKRIQTINNHTRGVL